MESEIKKTYQSKKMMDRKGELIMLEKIRTNKKGFTLAELLIVVAIIAVLVAISIPVFTSQLEKSREATDAANLRAAYAEVMVEALENEGTVTPIEVTAKQTQSGWQSDAGKDIGGVTTVEASTTGWTVGYDSTNNVATFTAK